MEVHLTRGVVAAIWKDAAAVAAAGVPPVLQVVEVRPMSDGPGCYATMLSDGDYAIDCALLAGHYANLLGLPAGEAVLTAVRTGCLRRGSVVRLSKVMGKTHLGRRFIFARQLEVLQTDCMLIGNPKQYRSGQLEDKHEELDAQLVTSSHQLNIGPYSSGQCFKELLTRGMVAMLQQPVMQVVGVMRPGLEEFEKFRLVISDGLHTQNARLASHLNHLVKEGLLRNGTIVRILDFTCNNVWSPSMVDISQLEVLQTECELIGSPKAYKLCCIGKPYGLQIECGEPYYGSVANYAQPDNPPYCGKGFKWYLTRGAVVTKLGGDMEVEQRLVMQVVDVSLVSPAHPDCTLYKVLLSDGIYMKHALLFPDLNPLVENGLLHNGTIVCILKCHGDHNYRIIFVQLEVLQTECELIGSPTFYEPGHRHNAVYADSAAYVPALPALNDSMPEDAASSCGQSSPRYKATPG